jgi:molybdenum cofactor cytidylyltransferase
MSVGIVILAAGASTRMGEPKQLLEYRGRTLLQNVVDTAQALPGAEVAVVLGAHAAQIRGQFETTSLLVVENSDWREGMGSSLRTGLRALLGASPEISAVIFLLCDQPLLATGTLRSLVDAHQRTGSAIVASQYNGTLGAPALFARSFFSELLALEGTKGAKEIIRAHREQAIGVPFPDGAVDIDTPGEYASLPGIFLSPTV